MRCQTESGFVKSMSKGVLPYNNNNLKKLKMRKFFILMVVALFVPNPGDSQSTDDFVLLGQLYGTQTFGFFEKLRGKVMEIRQTNYFTREENGKIVKVRILTTEDRKTTPSGRDYFEEFNSSGTILKEGVLDETGRLLEYWDVDADSGKILSAAYYVNDILRANIRTKYNGNNLEEIIYLLPGTEVEMKRVLIGYDLNGNRIKYQHFIRNQPGTQNEYIYNDKGLLEAFNVYSGTGQLIEIYRYTYNDKGFKLTQHQETYNNGDIRDYRFEYEYDDKGNYVKIIFIKDNKPAIYRERQIKYFD